MNPPEPRLNKLPFIITALVCFTVVVLIGLFAGNRFSPTSLLTAVVFLVASIAAMMFPVLADFTADSREAANRTREELEAQVARVLGATESLVRAAAQLKAVEEAAHKSARDAEALPYRMQEKLAEFNEALAAKENEEREALEHELEDLRAANSDQLRAVAEKIGQAATDWAVLEASVRKQLAAAQEIAARIDQSLKNSLAHTESKPTGADRPSPAPEAKVTPVAAEEPAAGSAPVIKKPRESAAALTPPAAVVSTPPVTPPAANHAPSVEPARPKPVRASRKPKPEDTLAAMSEAPALQESAAENSAAMESSTSSDGATRLLATAYIGIGNKLFIRGDGPGLSWDRGVPMQFVSIGKWGWSTHDAAGPIRIKLYKNDDSPALSGELQLEPGRHTETTALF
jgi:hypothetical protein